MAANAGESQGEKKQCMDKNVDRELSEGSEREEQLRLPSDGSSGHETESKGEKTLKDEHAWQGDKDDGVKRN